VRFWASPQGGAMFLWWSPYNKKKASPQADPEQTQRDIDVLADELSSATLARPSPVSKAKYNKWAVVETNRQVGDQMRSDGDDLNSQRRSMRSQFLQEGNQRAQAAREQREAASERVRQYREYNASRGAHGKAIQQESKRMTEENKAAWQEHGARTAMVQGVEQRERVIESRAEREEARRLAASQHKQGIAERQAGFREATKKQIMEKRSRVARIRAETKPEVAAASKEHFFSRRKEVADDVRQSVRDWRVEQHYRKEEALARARENHDMAVSAQSGAIDQQTILQEMRRQQASQMRDDIKSIEQRKEITRLTQEMVKRGVHDESYEGKFVEQDAAELVVSSAYDTLANIHRENMPEPNLEDGGFGTGNWIRFFGSTTARLHDGFFNSFFGGGETTTKLDHVDA